MTRDLLRATDVGDDLEALAGLRYALQSQHFNRHGGTGFDHRLAAIIEHRADLAEDLSDDEWIADVQRALLHQRSRDRAAAAIKFRLKHDTRCQTSRAGS